MGAAIQRATATIRAGNYSVWPLWVDQCD